MSIGRLCKRVTSFGFTLLEQGYAIDARPHAVSPVTGHVKSLSWAKDGSTPRFLPATPRVDDYLVLLRDGEYSYLMRDGGIIQILYQYDDAHLVRHRLLYWPCPFDLEDAPTMLGEPVTDVLETHFLYDTRSQTVLRGSFRFDFVPETAREHHPASHLTVAGPECRIPVHAPLSFDTFMRFVLENFYRAAWLDAKVAACFSFQQEAKSLRTGEDQRVHLAWQYSATRPRRGGH